MKIVKVLLTVALAAAAGGCTSGSFAAGTKPAPISWIAGAPGPSDARCPAFDAVAPGADGWWLSGPDCLLHAAADESLATLLPLHEAEWGFDRVDGLAADGDGAVWAAGRQRRPGAVRAVMANVRSGTPEVGAPERWGFEGVLLNAVTAPRGGAVWAVGRHLGGPQRLFVARRQADGWSVIDTAAFGDGELVDADFTADGCGWFLGRNGDGSGLLIRYDGRRLHKEVLDRTDGVPDRVAALSCSDLWLGGTSAIRYAEGHREEIGFTGAAEINGMAVCPGGDLLIVGERVANEPEMQGRRVGFSFRVRGGEVNVLPVELPFVVEDWRLADVGCDERGAWAVGAAAARFAVDQPTERRALILRLGDTGWKYRGWQYR